MLGSGNSTMMWRGRRMRLIIIITGGRGRVVV